MRMLITGGAGCLGASIVQRYKEQASILVLDNFATSSREALPDDSRHFKVACASVEDADAVERCFEQFRPDTVIHAAASYKNPHDWRGDLAVNALGSINVVNAARQSGVARIVNFQSVLCYGRPDSTPIPIDAPLRPFTSYGISKVAGEQYMMMSDINAISLRIANVVGPRLAIGPLPAFYSRLKAGQRCFYSPTVRDFLDMDDFLALLDLAIRPDAPGGVFHAGTGEGRSILDVFHQVAAHLGVVDARPEQAPLSQDDVAEVVLDPSLTTQVFGWRPQVSFQDSVRRVLGWYDHHGVRAIYSHLAAPGSKQR
jgi:UDP-glucose 4-epimerase